MSPTLLWGRRAGLAGLAALLLAGCPTNEPVDVCLTTLCGAACCTTADQVCDRASGACCKPTSCENRECGDDGCGHPCGTGCAKGTRCKVETWTCEACPSENHDDFCKRQATLGKVCGSVTEVSPCTGEARTEDCPACSNGRECAADNSCSGPCDAKSPADFCAAFGKDCGTFTEKECGDDRTEDCGTCTGGSCEANVCVKCSYEGDQSFCDRMAKQGKVCGDVADKDDCGVRRTVHCGTRACLGFEYCQAATNTCQACVAESHDEFCARLALAGLRCGTVEAPDNCGHARAEDCGDPCPAGGKVCRDHVCLSAGAPANDGCGAAEALVFGADEVATATGDTSLAAADLQGGCSGGAGPDVVYQFTVGGTAPRKVTVEVAAIGSRHLAPVVYLRADCSAGPDLACARDFSQATARVNLLAPGTYFVVVDSESAIYAGPFDLKVSLGTPDPVPANDTCDSAIDVTHATGPLSGTTLAAKDDSQGSCATAVFKQDGPDVVYSFIVPPSSQRSARITVVADPAATGFHPTVSLRKNCGDPESELKCADYQGSGQSSLFFLDLGPGQYFVLVDGENASQGAFQLTVELAAAINLPDTCDQVQRLDLSALDPSGNGSVVAHGDTTWAQTSGSSNKCGGSGPDVVYLLVTNEAMGVKDVRITATFEEATAWPVIYLNQGACAAPVSGDELGCASGEGAASFVKRSLPPGNYFVWVDGYGESAGKFTLQLDLSTPVPIPKNDVCSDDGSTAEKLTLDAAGHAAVTGNTLLAAGDDASASCGLSYGLDLVYVVDTTGLGERDLTASVSFANPTAEAAVLVWSTCDPQATGREVACDAPVGRTATATARKVPEGRYYVWVDSASKSEGPFTLTVDARPPPPSPCTTAPAIDLATGGGTARGSTLTAPNFTRGSCGGEKSGDAVFSFTLTAAHKIVAKVTPTATSIDFRPVAYLRKAPCESESRAEQLGCAQAAHAGDAAELTVMYVEPGTYWLWVDGVTSAGDFEVQVQTDVPVLPPANDTCANPTPLVLGGGPVAGDTSSARADYGATMNATCYGQAFEFNAPGHDVVYRYTPAQDDPFLVTVTPETDGDPYLWYTEGTCGGDGSTCVGASDAETSAGSESIWVEGKAGTTYYFYVDRYSDSEPVGKFNIELKSLQRPPNDTCGPDGTGATPLVQGLWTEGDSTLATADYGDLMSADCYDEANMYDAKGREVVYSYAPAADGDFTIVLQPKGWDAYLWYSEDSCGGDGSGCLGARDGALSGGSEKLTVYGLAGVTYYLYVDRYEMGGGGPFKIAIDPAGANIPNDTCGVDGANAIELTKGVPIQGDLTGAQPDYGTFISPACYADTGYPAAGDDLVYLYVPPKNEDFVIEVTPVGWDPALWYSMDACGGDGWWCVHAADAHGSGWPEKLVVHGVAGVHYFIYVDRYAADSGGGPFELIVR
ncbi:MAG TPA: hypothetical protein VGK67_07300 [Myxococcales bacterium]|jgi:hypothetical protein